MARTFPNPEEKSAKDYAQAVEAETIKAERIKQRLKELADLLVSTPSLWGGATSLGFECMLWSTDFPVREDRVLDGGFSPSEWFLNVGNAAGELAFSVAERFWKDCKAKKGKIEQLLMIHPNKTKSTNSEVLNRIQAVLRWGDVVERLDETTVKVLAFTWVADRLIVLESITCPEIEVAAQREVWRFLETMLEKNETALIEVIERAVSRVKEIRDKVGSEEIEVADWAEIIQLPWG